MPKSGFRVLLLRKGDGVTLMFDWSCSTEAPPRIGQQSATICLHHAMPTDNVSSRLTCHEVVSP